MVHLGPGGGSPRGGPPGGGFPGGGPPGSGPRDRPRKYLTPNRPLRTINIYFQNQGKKRKISLSHHRHPCPAIEKIIEKCGMLLN